MRARGLAIVGILAASVSACGYGIKATSDYDRRANVSNYGSFFMLKGNSSGDAVTDERLMSDVKNMLLLKGWLEVPEGDGQAAVIIHTATATDHTYESFYRGWGGWRWRWTPVSDPPEFAEDYKVGTVVVTIFDADAKQAIWRGFATDAISDNPKDAGRIREAAVARLFAKFPPVQ